MESSNSNVYKKTFILNLVELFTYLTCIFIAPFFSEAFNITRNVFLNCKLFCLMALLFAIIQNQIQNCHGCDKTKKTKKILHAYGWLKCFGLVLFATLTFHIIFVIYGISIVENAIETFNFAFMLSFLVVMPTFISANKSLNNWLQIVFILNSKEEILIHQSAITCITTIIGAWLGAFTIPLDWDKPWQIWPVSCVYSALLGHCFGLILGAMRLLLSQRMKSKKK